MILEARSPNCFSKRYVLKIDGREHGEFSARWFTVGFDIRLRGRRRLHLQKESWIGTRFIMTDSDGNILAEGNRVGFLGRIWDLELSDGTARLVSAGFFNTGFNVVRTGRTIAGVGRSGVCEGGWFVRGEGTLHDTDLLFIGLIYHMILSRRRRSSN